jgi:hypothetical protein
VTTPFLTDVKERFDGIFADCYDALTSADSDDEIAEALKTLHRSLWELVEKSCKQSYSNGRKGNGAKPSGAASNPFRKTASTRR